MTPEISEPSVFSIGSAKRIGSTHLPLLANNSASHTHHASSPSSSHVAFDGHSIASQPTRPVVLVLASPVELSPVPSLLLAVPLASSSVASLDTSPDVDASPLPGCASPHPIANANTITPDAARTRPTREGVYQEVR